MPQAARERPLLAYVLALAAILTVPPLALAVVTTGRWVESERARLRSITREVTDNAAAQVDRYIAGRIAMLQALATSPALDDKDFEYLHRQGRDLLDLQGSNIVIRDPQGQQYVNTRVAWGTPLPKVPLYDVDHEVARTLTPRISGLYSGVLSGKSLIRVIVPAVRGGRHVYSLQASLDPLALSRLLNEAGLREPYFGSIVDRSGVILAWAKHDESLVGRRLPGFERSVGSDGSWTGTNLAGVDVYGTFRRSQLSGWLLTAELDRALLDAPLYRSLAWLVAFSLVLAALAFLGSSVLAGRIIRSHRAVAAAAEALGHGDVVGPPQTPIRETNVIGRALADASSRLRQQSLAAITANRDLERRVEERTREVSDQADLIRVTLDNMDQGLMLLEADGTVPVCNRRALDLLDLPAELMRGRPTFEAVRRHQLAKDDFVRSDQLMKNWVANSGVERTQHSYERERPNGIVLEIRTVPMASGAAVRTFTDVTARKQAERLSHHMARHDGLTGLPNRTLFRERLTDHFAEVERGVGSFAVLCLDLDRFKAVNDTLGHPAGDALLRQVAERIAGLVAPGDTFARLGGDEYAIIQADGSVPETSERLARAIIDAVRRPFDLEGQVVSVGVSIGIAIAPLDGGDADALFKNADLALYRAKGAGRNALRYYEAAMDAAIQARLALELELRRALDRGQFTLVYQPVVAIPTGRVAAFEALLRWEHPEHGTIGPGEFIPIAEDARLIVPIGAWVLREACREAASWPEQTVVSVNISAIQVEDAGLLASVLSALSASGLPAHRLQLEITETVLMHENETVLCALHALRDAGIRIALDDFGTGHASLTYLRQFPLDGIKIDRSFVQGLDNATNAAILAAVIGLGRALGITVTAEGVETADQLERVRLAGCTEVQGYLFSRPLSARNAFLLLGAEATARAA